MINDRDKCILVGTWKTHKSNLILSLHKKVCKTLLSDSYVNTKKQNKSENQITYSEICTMHWYIWVFYMIVLIMYALSVLQSSKDLFSFLYAHQIKREKALWCLLLLLWLSKHTVHKVRNISLFFFLISLLLGNFPCQSELQCCLQIQENYVPILSRKLQHLRYVVIR